MVDPKDIDFYSLGFNFIETKTMFMATHKNGKWNEGELMPFGNFEISPASCVINYGQGIFEGMKALKGKNGEITLFRPKENAKRFNFSAMIVEELYISGLFYLDMGQFWEYIQQKNLN